MTKEKESML